MGLLNSSQFEDESDTPATASVATTRQAPKPTPTTQAPRNMATTTSAPGSSTKVVTGVIRGSYVKVFKAELPHSAKEGDIPKFSMTLLIPKTDTTTLKKIADAQKAAANLKWPNKLPPKIDTTLHDGDLPRPSTGEDFGDECKGHMVMAVSSKFRPKLLDRDGNEILDGSQVGSGDYFKASINAYGYDVQGKRGISFGLNNLLFWEKGDSLGGTTRAEDDFADDLPQG